MRILHIIQALTPTAGTTVFVLKLAQEQMKLGHEVAIAVDCGIDQISTDGIEVFVAKDLSKLPIIPNVVHIHAVWSLCQVSAMRWCQKMGYKYVVSIHGCLMPRVFVKSPLKKWIFYLLLLKQRICKASLIHCTSEDEVDVCRKLGFEGPYIIAPLGVDMPTTVERCKSKICRMVLFVGRLGEEKGLVNLLDAWKILHPDGWRLVLAGPDLVGFKKVLDKKISAEAIGGVEFVGVVNDEGKGLLYGQADVFVLPSPMENFSMVVLEALSYGVPVVATKGTPWKDLADNKCGWWIEQGVDALANALKMAMALSDSQRNEMGNNGRKLAAVKYQWRTISETIVNAYKGLV